MQSSALPLGHAANLALLRPSKNRISHSSKNLLFLSNGHGEDLIALQILQALHELHPSLSLEVLPLVGEGKVFATAVADGWLQKVGPTIRLPSGGFSNQSVSGLFKDICAGLFEITWEQWRFIQRESQKGLLIIAVGDLFPLFFAWCSGVSFGFIGTPKSDYTWRSGPGHAMSDYYHCLKGTEWDPWEYALMRSPRCKMVAVRDHLTARGLRKHGVKAQAPGNPMMDGLKREEIPDSLQHFRRCLLLCGSRVPEAQSNFQRLMAAISLVDSQTPIAILAALGSEPSVDNLDGYLADLGFRQTPFLDDEIGVQSLWIKGSCNVFIGPGKFSLWASWAEIGLVTAGTATEQLAGLGIPALSLPGEGPQFNRTFAVRQSRLLGGAVVPCKSPGVLASRLKVLLKDQSLRENLGLVGTRRMGVAGGSAALAALVSKFLLGH